MDELEDNLRIETVKGRMKEKPVSIKTRNKEIARKQIIELKKKIEAEIIIEIEE